MGKKQASFLKVHYFHVPKRYHNDIYFSIELSVKLIYNFFKKLYRENWPKFAQVSKKKSTNPSDVGTYSFR
jgi:hypothetical protein